MPDSYEISTCAVSDRPEAFKVLHAGLTTDQQTALVQALDALRDQGIASLETLLVAHSAGRLVETCWIQPMPGNSALVWPPGGGNPASQLLMREVATWLDEHEISLAQILVSPDAPFDEAIYTESGFHRLADLAYLTVEREYFPSSLPNCQLQFVPRASDHPQRLEKVLLKTYENSQDCPQLNGLRKSSKVLEGYRAQGRFLPEHWYLVTSNSQDVGVLILANHAEGANWELVYMGVVPEFRARGVGRAILQFALGQAKDADAERVVLAVDEKNHPGREMYRRAGFVPWDRRRVYARLRKFD